MYELPHLRWLTYAHPQSTNGCHEVYHLLQFIFLHLQYSIIRYITLLAAIILVPPTLGGLLSVFMPRNTPPLPLTQENQPCCSINYYMGSCRQILVDPNFVQTIYYQDKCPIPTFYVEIFSHRLEYYNIGTSGCYNLL